MSLLRAGARTMLASYFVVSGVKALRNPDQLVPAAEPVADRVVPVVKKYAPQQVATVIPEEAVNLVRANGAAQVVGGLGLATGFGRRLGALLLATSIVPSTVAKHPFWSKTDPEERAMDRAHFLKNTSLLGGVLLAALDTEGKPSIAYRAQKGGRTFAKETRRARKSFAKTTSSAADEALAGGAALAGAIAATSRSARKKAAKELKNAKELAAKQAAELKEAADRAAKESEKEARKRQKTKKRSKNIRRGEN
jgi:uncharacterized membrane protein YphA (DoxX/SURF4 family)